jgi:Spy/CpxP family protein refolding chaperone
MRIVNRTVAAAILTLFAALAASDAGQTPQRDPSQDGRLSAWEKQMVLPQAMSARLIWAERRLQPSGRKKLDGLAKILAPDIAGGAGFAAVRDKAASSLRQMFPGLAGMDVSEAAFIVMAMATEDLDDDLRMIMAEIKATNAAKQKLREMNKALNDWISKEMSQSPSSGDLQNEKVTKSKPVTRTARPVVKSRSLTVVRTPLEKRISPIIHFEYARAPELAPLPPRNPGLTVGALKDLSADLKGQLDSLNELSEMTSLRLQMTMDRRSKVIETLSQMIEKVSTTQDIIVQNIK